MFRICSVICCVLLAPSCVYVTQAQSASASPASGTSALPSSPERTALLAHLQASTQRQQADVTVRDVVLQGTATRTSGSKTEPANVILRATANGNSTLVLSGEGGTVLETTALSSTQKRLKKWHVTGTQNVPLPTSGAAATSSSSTTPATTGAARPTTLFPVLPWCLPYFILQATIANQQNLDMADMPQMPGSQDIGVRMRYHITDPKVALSGETLGTYPNEVVLDHETMLPKSVVFRQVVSFKNSPSVYVGTHPVIEERIEYSDYKQVQGFPIPMHIRVLMQKQPYLDIQITTAQINTGLSIPTPEE